MMHRNITRCVNWMRRSTPIKIIIACFAIIVFTSRFEDKRSVTVEATEPLQQNKYVTGNSQYDTRPFDANASKLALLLSYQRCGSTFAGGLFNENEKAFYMFEPVDGIYSSMYGSLPGFNVPSDIFNYWNGTERMLPPIETQYVAKVMTSLLTCDFRNVPTEVLLHRFLFLFRKQHISLEPYKECLVSNNITISSISACWKKHLKKSCVDRFGSNPKKEEVCRLGLIGDKPSIGQDSTQHALNGYKDCLRELRHTFDICEPHMMSICTSSELIATKTVRLTMASAEIMMKQSPNLRIIHLIRDPRAVALSRMTDSTYRGKNSTGNPIREAEFYCKGVLKDVIVRKRIESKYPGTILQVIYEDLASHPLKIVREVYSFLNETVPMDVSDWIIQNTGTNEIPEKSLKIAEKWQDKLSYRTAQSIGVACQELFKAIGYNWPSI